MRRELPLMAALAALATVNAPVYAQTDNSQIEENNSQIEEIVVTAQRRVERLEDVPITVTAVSAERLNMAGVSDVSSLANVTPGLVFTQSQNVLLANLRGLGTQNDVAGDESHVPLYVDGVYWPAMSGAILAFNNIERVEVLKGPQGTLFGRNADAGLIQIITKDPVQTPSVNVTLGYGNYDAYQGQLYATGGITSNLAADIAVYRYDQIDGFGRDLATGQPVNSQSQTAVRSKWILDVDDATKATASADYEHVTSSLGNSVRLAPGSLGLNGLPFTGGFYDTDSNLSPFFTTTQWGASLKLRHSFSAMDFVSTSGYRDLDAHVPFDYDLIALPIANVNYATYSRNFSQELQLQSRPDSAPKWLNWVAGVYYFHSEDGYDPLYLNGSLIPTFLGYEAIYSRQNTVSYAGYTQATAEVLPKTNLTLGVRYTIDERNMRQSIDSLLGPGSLGTVYTDAKFPKTTYRISLDHHFWDNLMAYVSVNRGFKSGLYNLLAMGSADLLVAPETLEAYEIGLKSELFDRRFVTNIAAFYYDESNLQLLTVAGTSTILVNAASATTKGLDFDTTFRATDTLSLQLGAEFLDASYDKFHNAPDYVPAPGGGNELVPGFDASGKDMEDAPKAVVNVGADYTVPTRMGPVDFDLSYNHNSGFYFEPTNALKQSAYSLLNGTVKWVSGAGPSADGLWRVQLWGKNLLNTKYYRSIFSTGFGYQAAVGDPLTFGVTISRHFGG